MKRIAQILAIAAAVLLGVLIGLSEQAAYAVKVVSYTLQPVTAADIQQLVVRRSTVAGGGTQIIAVGYFDVKDELGTTRYVGSVPVTLNASQITAIQGFINTHVAPAFNTQEGL